MISKRAMLLALAFASAAALPAASRVAAAQDYPSRPIRFVTPFPPGPSDLVIRLYAQKISEDWGQPVVVDNRPGATGSIGAAFVAKAEANGYTLLTTPTPVLAINQWLYKTLSYDPEKDFVPIINAATTPNLWVVHPEVPARSLQELIALAKAKPGAITYASGGIGSGPHLAMELFKSMAGVDLLHVPYKGTGPALNDLDGGRVQVMVSVTASAEPLMKSGSLRALAVTGAVRSPGLPDLPTIAESGVPNYAFNTWYGVQVPAGTPPSIIARLNADIIRVLQGPDIRARLTALGLEPMTSSPEAFGNLVRSEIAKWAKVVDAIGLKVD